MTRRIAVALALLLGCAQAHALTREQRTLFFGSDDRIRVNPRIDPWRMVVKWGTRAGLQCSGALIAPDIVVSAGHCLASPTGRTESGGWVWVGYRNGRYLHRRAIASAWSPPEFRKGLRFRKDGMYIDAAVAHLDISFLRLAQPVPDTVGYFQLAPADRITYLRLVNALGWRATQSGYAADQEHVQLAHPFCNLTRFNPNRTLMHRCDSLEGDSGAPIFAIVGGKPTLLAVQSSAPSAAQRYRVDNVAVTVPAFAALLDQWRNQAAEAPREPKAGVSRR